MYLYHVTTGTEAGLGKMSPHERDYFSFTIDPRIAEHIATILKVYSRLMTGAWSFSGLKKWVDEYYGKGASGALEKRMREIEIGSGKGARTNPFAVADAFNRFQLIWMFHHDWPPQVWVVERGKFVKVKPSGIHILVAEPKPGAKPRMLVKWVDWNKKIEKPEGEEILKERRYKIGDFVWVGEYIPGKGIRRFPGPTESFAEALSLVM